VIDDHGASKSKKSKKTEDDFESLQVMQFRLKMKDGLVYMGSEPKPKPATEETLKKKFGARYADVRGCFDDGLKSWRGKEEELTRVAFGMYERFRPTVKAGEKGWGRKGELNLDTVRDVVMKS